MVPFNNEMKEIKEVAKQRYNMMDKMDNRLDIVEIFAQIRVRNDDNKNRKKNKFELIDEQIMKNRVELQEQMSDFSHQNKRFAELF